MNREDDIVQTFISLLNDSGVTHAVFEQNYGSGNPLRQSVVVQLRFGSRYNEYVVFYDENVRFDSNHPARLRTNVEYSDPILAHLLSQCVDADSFRLILRSYNGPM